VSKTHNLGEFEIMVMAALLHLKDEAYGAAIRNEIEQKTQRTASVGAIYTTLSRMEKKGYVESQLGKSTAERGGKAKRYFQVTQDGYQVFKESVGSLNSMLDGISL